MGKINFLLDSTPQKSKRQSRCFPFTFNNFHDARPATPFVSCFCIVARGWVPAPSRVKVMLELPFIGPSIRPFMRKREP
jgi:hypothetical protein